MHHRKLLVWAAMTQRAVLPRSPGAMAQPHLVLLHQACGVVPHGSCVMHHNEVGLPAELVMAQAGAACQGTSNACLELGCTAWSVKAAFLRGVGLAVGYKSERVPHTLTVSIPSPPCSRVVT